MAISHAVELDTVCVEVDHLQCLSRPVTDGIIE